MCLAVDFSDTLFNLSIFYVRLVPIVVELTNDMLVKGRENDVLFETSENLDSAFGD